MSKRRMIHRWAALGALALFGMMPAGCDLLTLEELEEPVATSLQVVTSRDNQQGEAGQALPLPVQVRVLDQNGDPYTDLSIAVNWSVLTGGGSVDPASSSTDQDAIASTAWTLGPAAGPQTLQAWSAGIDTVTIGATAVQTFFPDSLIVGTATAAGDSAMVQIRLRITQAQAGLQFTLAFDDSLTAGRVTATARLDTMTLFDSAGLQAGSLVVVVASELISPLPTIEAGSDAIVSVLFRIAPGTAPGTYTLQVTDARVSDTMGVVTIIETGDGAIIVP